LNSRELNGLFLCEENYNKVILPVWHGVDQKEVARYSPMLADRVAADTTPGLDYVARSILKSTGDAYTTILKPAGLNISEAEALAPFNNPEIFVGKNIYSYHIHLYIGRGGAGLVFGVTRPPQVKEVCTKLFYPIVDVPSAVMTSYHEILNVVRQLRHPGIVSVIESIEGSDEGSTFNMMIMEMIRGIPLLSWSRYISQGDTPLVRKLNSALKITDAVQYLHTCVYTDSVGMERNGLTHGDIKPDNILVADGDVPKLLDVLLFDYTRYIDAKYTEDRMRTPNQALTLFYGTPG
jgi:serine/threonine protein kinase